MLFYVISWSKIHLLVIICWFSISFNPKSFRTSTTRLIRTKYLPTSHTHTHTHRDREKRKKYTWSSLRISKTVNSSWVGENKDFKQRSQSSTRQVFFFSSEWYVGVCLLYFTHRQASEWMMIGSWFIVKIDLWMKASTHPHITRKYVYPVPPNCPKCKEHPLPYTHKHKLGNKCVVMP